MKRFIILFTLAILASDLSIAQDQSLSLNGFSQWRTGHDEKTSQLIPAGGIDALVKENGQVIVHVKFNVVQYGEVSFPINQKSIEGEEAMSIDLSKSEFVRISYRSNHKFVLQLRQTGVHGGVHNHVILQPSKRDTTVTIPFTEFKGGKTPLYLHDVAKFNFAFLSNKKEDGYAELRISNFSIEQ